MAEFVTSVDGGHAHDINIFEIDTPKGLFLISWTTSVILEDGETFFGHIYSINGYAEDILKTDPSLNPATDVIHTHTVEL